MIKFLVEFFGAMSLFLAIAQLSSNRLNLSIKIYQLQSVFLSMSILFIGIVSSEFELYISSFLNFLIKVILIPFFLFKVVEKIKLDREVSMYLNITNSLLFSILIVIFAFYISNKIDITGEVIAKQIFPLSLGIIFIGIFIMISRKKALSQIIGFLTMENGILLAGTSLTKGMPMIVEIGVFFDVFVGVLMAGVLIFQIKTTVESIDTSRLSDLKE
jgi:hydrogenase-4 component E